MKPLSVGETFSFERVMHKADVDAFAKLSGDYSPIHADDDYAAKTSFKKRLVHGMHLGAFVSELVGMHVTTKDRVYVCMKVSLEFKKPVYIGETIQVSGTVANISKTTGVAELELSYLRGTEKVAGGTVYAKLIG